MTSPKVELQTLQRALERTGGKVSRAARLQGVSRDTMRYRMARHAVAQGPSGAELG